MATQVQILATPFNPKIKMKLVIISDSHDNIPELNKVFEMLKKNNIKEVIHCGDLCAPFMIDELEKHKIKVHLIFGNIEDRYRTTQKCLNSKYVKQYGDEAELVLDKKRIFVVHYPIYANIAAESGKYDAVFYGHTHKIDKQKKDKTLLINPGEFSVRYGKTSFAIYDTESNNAEIIEISN